MSATDDLKSIVDSLSMRLDTLEKALNDALESSKKSGGLNDDLYRQVQAFGSMDYKVHHFVKWVKSTQGFKDWLIAQRVKGNDKFLEKDKDGNFKNPEVDKILNVIV